MKRELDAYVALMRRRDEHDRSDPEWSRLNDEVMARWRALQQPLPRPRSAAGLERLIRDELDCHPADKVGALLARCRRGSGKAARSLVSLAPNRLRGRTRPACGSGCCDGRCSTRGTTTTTGRVRRPAAI